VGLVIGAITFANGFGASHTGSPGLIFTSDSNTFTVLCKFVIVMTNITDVYI
jgi:hypothetical protein